MATEFVSDVGDSVRAVASTTGNTISKVSDKVTDEIGTVNTSVIQHSYSKNQKIEQTSCGLPYN